MKSSLSELADWTRSFDAWRKKVMVTPKIYTNWGLQEKTLSNTFQLLPCIPNGLSFIVDLLEAVEGSGS